MPANDALLAEKVKRVGFPPLVIALLVAEFILQYVLSSLLYIMKEVTHSVLRTLQESVINNMSKMQAIGVCFSIIPAWLADSYFGKYWMFFMAYMLSCFWPISTLILLYDGPLNSMRSMAFQVATYYTIIVFSIEAVRSAILCEQLELPQQEKNLPLFMSLFYVERQLANFAASTWLSIEGQNNSKFLLGHTAFLVILFVGYVFFFMFIKKNLKGETPVNCIYAGGVSCMCSALIKCIKERRKKVSGPKNHFMDFAENKHDVFYIYNCKVFLKILPYICIAFFVGLSEQMVFKITKYQMKYLVPLQFLPPGYSIVHLGYVTAILWFLIWNITLVPNLHRFKIKLTILQLFGVGYLLTGLALFSSLFVQLNIDNHSTILPRQGFGQLRIYNTHPSVISLQAHSLPTLSSTWFHIPPYSMWVGEKVVKDEKTDFFTFKYTDPEANGVERTNKIEIEEEKSVSYIIMNDEVIRVEGSDPLIRGPPGMNNPLNPRIYILCGMRFCFGTLVFKNDISTNTFRVPPANNRFNLFTLPLGAYNVTSVHGDYSNSVKTNFKVEIGGVYAVLVYSKKDSEGRGASFFSVVKPNSLSVTLVIPQIIFYNFGVLFSRVYSSVFIYSQAPPKLRCTFWALGPLAHAAARSLLFVDSNFWHHQPSLYEILGFLLVHFAVMCFYFYMSLHYEYQGWTPEGAVFQNYPPLATRYLYRDRKKITLMKKLESESEADLAEGHSAEEHARFK